MKETNHIDTSCAWTLFVFCGQLTRRKQERICFPETVIPPRPTKSKLLCSRSLFLWNCSSSHSKQHSAPAQEHSQNHLDELTLRNFAKMLWTKVPFLRKRILGRETKICFFFLINIFPFTLYIFLHLKEYFLIGRDDVGDRVREKYRSYSLDQISNVVDPRNESVNIKLVLFYVTA